jgi:hypothetical protein
MIPISIADAFREFERLSKNSLVGINFGRADASVCFFLRRASLEVKEPGLFVEVKGTSIALLRFDKANFFELTAEDVKQEFARLGSVSPSFETCIGAKFPNDDFCLIFGER